MAWMRAQGQSTTMAGPLHGSMESSIAALLVHREMVRAEPERDDDPSWIGRRHLRRDAAMPQRSGSWILRACLRQAAIVAFDITPVLPGTLRDLGKRRLPVDELAEKIVAEAILEHLQLCGWRLEHKTKPRVAPAG